MWWPLGESNSRYQDENLVSWPLDQGAIYAVLTKDNWMYTAKHFNLPCSLWLVYRHWGANKPGRLRIYIWFASVKPIFPNTLHHTLFCLFIVLQTPLAEFHSEDFLMLGFALCTTYPNYKGFFSSHYLHWLKPINIFGLAIPTRLELAIFCVTGRCVSRLHQGTIYITLKSVNCISLPFMASALLLPGSKFLIIEVVDEFIQSYI